MLVIFSDTHLSDGTTGTCIDEGAFKIFRDTLRDMAYDASWRADGAYRPIDEIQLILLGDVFDVIRSTSWLESDIKPWDNSQDPRFAVKVEEITRRIIESNHGSLTVLRELDADGCVTIPPATENGMPADVEWEPWDPARHKVRVRRHYLVGNHDWFYHLQGPQFDRIRALIVTELGLENSSDQPFPHEIIEAPVIEQACRQHRVFARHGDIYDDQNYEGNRDRSSLGDAIVIELLSRFPYQVKNILGSAVSSKCIKDLKEIDNIRPLEMSVPWIAGVLDRTCGPDEADAAKKIWNKIVADFFRIDFVKRHRSPKYWPTLLIWRVSQHFSMRALSSIILSWVGRHIRGSSAPNYRNALAESILTGGETWTVVYGHTHVYQLVPLDSAGLTGNSSDQIYINSGTWRPYHELTERDPASHTFVGYHVLTILAFYNNGERRGRSYEVWNGVLDDREAVKRGGAMPSDVVGFTFREKMAGGFALGETDPDAGAKSGQAAHTQLTMHATIEIDDLDRFIADPDHLGSLMGTIDYPPLGLGLVSTKGVFNLFSPTNDPATKYMVYEMGFDAGGKSYYFAGHKKVTKASIADMWTATTTLYSQLHSGTASSDPVAGAGILTLDLAGLLAMIPTMRAVHAKSAGEAAQAAARFGEFFLGELWDTYVNRARL